MSAADLFFYCLFLQPNYLSMLRFLSVFLLNRPTTEQLCHSLKTLYYGKLGICCSSDLRSFTESCGLFFGRIDWTRFITKPSLPRVFSTLVHKHLMICNGSSLIFAEVFFEVKWRVFNMSVEFFVMCPPAQHSRNPLSNKSSAFSY